MCDYYDTLVFATRKYVSDSGLSGAIVGVSGGIDSALVLKIAVDALGSSGVEAVLMPSRYTCERSISVAIELVNNLDVSYRVLGIDSILDAFKSFPDLYSEPQSVVEQNMQSRIRGLMLMTMSNKFDRIVLATGNRSEILTGYSTIYGDTCGGYAPLKYVYKTEVYELARLCNQRCLDLSVRDAGGYRFGYIPDFIINREPTAELKFNQVDSNDLPPYHILDDILRKIVDLDMRESDIVCESYNLETVIKVSNLIRKYRYKRLQYPEGVNFKGYRDCDLPY